VWGWTAWRTGPPRFGYRGSRNPVLTEIIDSATGILALPVAVHGPIAQAGPGRTTASGGSVG
jgi:hypothetical protein